MQRCDAAEMKDAACHTLRNKRFIMSSVASKCLNDAPHRSAHVS